MVGRSSYDLVSLGVELNLADLVLVALQQGRARAREYVIYARNSVCRSGGQFVSGTIKSGVKHFILVPAESLYTLTTADVPQLAGTVDAARQAIVASKIELSARKFARVPLESEQALPRAHVPNLGRVVEGTSQQFVTVSVEVK